MPPLDDSSTPSSGLDSVLKQVGSLTDKISAQQAPETAQMRSLEQRGKTALTALEGETNRKMPDAPKMPELPKAPNIQQPNPMEALGQPLTVLAIFASALTKAPLTTALNSAASAMTEYRKGNLEAAKQAQAQYKEAIDTAFKQHQSEMESYRALMEEHGQTIRGKAAVLEAIGAAHGWQEASRLAKAGQVDQALKLVDMQERAFERVSREKFLEKQFEEGKTPEQQIFNQWKKEHPNATAEEEAKFRNTMHVGTSPQSIALENFRQQTMAEKGREPTADETVNFLQRMRPPRSPAAMALQKYMEENPNANADQLARFGQDYAARAKAVAAFSTGKQGDIVRSFNTATEHLATLDKLAEALDNHDTQAFNRIANAWAKQTGAVAPNNLNSAVHIVSSEIVKAVVGAGGALGDRESAAQPFADINSPAQLKGATETVRELIGGQLKGLKKQYEDTTGRDDFDKRLTGAASQALGGHGKTYQKGDIVEKAGKKYRVTGGDPADPDVEEVR